MNIKERFEDIRDYLALDQSIWEREIIEQDIAQWPTKQKNWLDQLKYTSHYELWRGLQKENVSDQNFWRHLDKVNKLGHVPSKTYKQQVTLPSWAFQKVKHKKQHEISILAQALQEIKIAIAPKSLIDIGAGQGHFSRVMAHYYGWPTISIEREKDLQNKAIKRLEKHPAPIDCASLSFINLDFQGLQGTSSDEQLNSIFNESSFSLGLHTCGPLANRHLETFKKTKSLGVLNFGCCYGKLNPDKDINLSQVSAQRPLKLSSYALNLAARAHQKMSYPEFCFQERVKTYRYTLEIYLRKYYPEFAKMAVGDAHLKDYSGSFSRYALKRFAFLGVKNKTDEQKQLEKFFLSRFIKDQVADLFLADIIRWSYGRLIELYVLYDRCLYLQQTGELHVELNQYFNEKLSPRNLGILAYSRPN